MLLFLYLVLVPWRRFRAAVKGDGLPEAAAHLNRIRRVVEINLVLGIVTVVVGATCPLLAGPHVHCYEPANANPPNAAGRFIPGPGEERTGDES
jgi:hypothetical protein